MEIVPFEEKYQAQLINMILNIQQNEFGIKINENDQPDLKNIQKFYCADGGNFWLAIENEVLIGSVALIHLGEGVFVLRKMFVNAQWRGKEKGVAQALINTAERWVREHNGSGIYLGTTEQFKAAQRFYTKNGYEQIEKSTLPQAFPLMLVDTVFFMKQF